MTKNTRFSPEVRQRAVRMVLESQGEYDSQWATICSIAPKIGCTHYWCEISNNDEFHIVDISADQFGFEGVIVKNIKEVEGWPRYIPGNQDVVNAGVEELFNHGY